MASAAALPTAINLSFSSATVAGLSDFCAPVSLASSTKDIPPSTLFMQRRATTDTLNTGAGATLPSRYSIPFSVWYRRLLLTPMWSAQVAALSSVGGGLLGVSNAGSMRFRIAISPLEIAVPVSPAANPTTAKVAPLDMIVATREPREYAPGSNMWLGSADAADDAAVGARRYMRTKLRMDPTTSVEKTKSNSLRPKLGREAMSPSTQAVTPTSSSMSTLKGNCGSAATRAAHPARRSPRMPPRRPSPPPEFAASPDPPAPPYDRGGGGSLPPGPDGQGEWRRRRDEELAESGEKERFAVGPTRWGAMRGEESRWAGKNLAAANAVVAMAIRTRGDRARPVPRVRDGGGGAVQ
uniref:Uncharacterized protein n=1 Tax=Zea mays TaxID=4577 RepID=C0PN08_MAIZE|nr:unknown [Zea mays]